MPDVSVVIVNWNSKDHLERCVASIQDQTRLSTFEIIVIDNASYDGCAEMLREKFPEVLFSQSTENVGFSAGNNIGLKRSGGRYILLLNPDTLILGRAIDCMVKFMDAHAEYGAVGSRSITGDGSIDFHAGRNSPTILREFSTRLGINKLFRNSRRLSSVMMEDWDHASSRDVELLSGSCMMFRRAVFSGVGLLDPNYFMYGDDVDYCHRIMKAGWKIFYLADAEIIHFGSGSSARTARPLKVEGIKSMRYFYAKHYGKIHAFIYDALIIVSAGAHLSAETIKRLAGRGETPNPRSNPAVEAYRAILSWYYARFTGKA